MELVTVLLFSIPFTVSQIEMKVVLRPNTQDPGSRIQDPFFFLQALHFTKPKPQNILKRSNMATDSYPFDDEPTQSSVDNIVPSIVRPADPQPSSLLVCTIDGCRFGGTPFRSINGLTNHRKTCASKVMEAREREDTKQKRQEAKTTTNSTTRSNISARNSSTNGAGARRGTTRF